ncbi:MAG: hypothetical protein BECKG1743D_GA0114223_110511 [Candidatus Kentron sp. G]|nr:MAG: hypothetical protein BECKG1743D_GA0114223_110511 [Candidatus Kentron sp. G]
MQRRTKRSIDNKKRWLLLDFGLMADLILLSVHFLFFVHVFYHPLLYRGSAGSGAPSGHRHISTLGIIRLRLAAPDYYPAISCFSCTLFMQPFP